jgi:hypothetical protein
MHLSTIRSLASRSKRTSSHALPGRAFCLWFLFTGEVNRELRGVGQSLASYIYENIRFLTFNTEDRPFPLGNPWPSSEADEG